MIELYPLPWGAGGELRQSFPRYPWLPSHLLSGLGKPSGKGCQAIGADNQASHYGWSSDMAMNWRRSFSFCRPYRLWLDYKSALILAHFIWSVCGFDDRKKRKPLAFYYHTWTKFWGCPSRLSLPTSYYLACTVLCPRIAKTKKLFLPSRDLFSPGEDRLVTPKLERKAFGWDFIMSVAHP